LGAKLKIIIIHQDCKDGYHAARKYDHQEPSAAADMHNFDPEGAQDHHIHETYRPDNDKILSVRFCAKRDI